MAPEPHSQTAGLLHNYCYYADGLTENIFPMIETEKLKSAPLAYNCSRTSRDFSSYFNAKYIELQDISHGPHFLPSYLTNHKHWLLKGCI